MIIQRLLPGLARTGPASVSVPFISRLLLLVTCLTLSLGSIILFHAQAFGAQAFGAQKHPAIAPVPAVSKTWYFADGRVGAGFQEYLTLSNPAPSTDCTAQIQYLPEGSVSPSVRTPKPLLVQTVSVAHASRFTTSVNHDLHIDQQQTRGILLSALVTVTGCDGLVVERPDSSPLAIITGPDGNLWFTKPNIAKVAYITTAGVITEINIGPNTNPADIILGPDNNIWFTDIHTGKLGRCLLIY